MVDSFQLLTIFTKGSIIDVCQGSKYTFGLDDAPIKSYISCTNLNITNEKMIQMYFY